MAAPLAVEGGGGSTDGSAAVLAASGFNFITSAKGRAVQMNAGATHARSELLLFLHADTLLPKEALASLTKCSDEGFAWGRFDVRITGQSLMFVVIVKSLINDIQ